MGKRPSIDADSSDAAHMSADAFVARVDEIHRLLWLVAAGILARNTDAEDVVQEATVIGMQKRADFEPGSNFKAWMVQIVRNVALNHGRKAQRRAAHEGGAATVDELPDHRRSSNDALADSPVDARGAVKADQRAFDDRVVTALQALGETARACLLLKTVEGLAYADIAAALGIPEGTAMSHVHRSRKEMRRFLAGHEAGGGAPQTKGR